MSNSIPMQQAVRQPPCTGSSPTVVVLAHIVALVQAHAMLQSCAASCHLTMVRATSPCCCASPPPPALPLPGHIHCCPAALNCRPHRLLPTPTPARSLNCPDRAHSFQADDAVNPNWKGQPDAHSAMTWRPAFPRTAVLQPSRTAVLQTACCDASLYSDNPSSR